ncbi:MAG TPA: MFS transporter [Chloroflexota bacterium]|nr:MFS transporter [Chloroflexota bacterium]
MDRGVTADGGASGPHGRPGAPAAPAASVTGARFAAFRHPAYRWYWLGQLATNVGTWMAVVATGWLLLELTDSPASLGLNAAFQGVPIVVFALVGGVVADRLDRYRLMVGAQVVQLLLDAGLAVLVASGAVTVPQIFVYSLLQAIVNGLSTPARQALVPRLVPRDALVSAVALNQSVWQGGAVLGPTLAGLVLAAFGTVWNFYINVISDVVCLAAMLLMRVPPEAPRPTGESAWSSLVQGARYSVHQADVRTLLLATGILCLLGRPYTQLMPAFARDVFHVGPEGLGVMLTMPSIGAIVAVVGLSVLGERDTARWFLRACVAAALALGAFAASPVYVVSLVMLLFVGGTTAAATALSNSLLLHIVDDRMRGRVMGYYMAATWGAWRLGAFPAGLVAAAWSTPGAIGLCAVLLLLAQVPVARSRLLRRAHHGVQAAAPEAATRQPGW